MDTPLPPIRTSQDVDELAAALAELNMGDVTRGSRADLGSYSYSYVNLHDLFTHIASHLHAAGLFLTQGTDPAGGVVTRILHRSGQWIEYGPLVIAAKGSPQEQGKAITFARRYAIMAALGLAGTDDDDDATSSEAAWQRHAQAEAELAARVQTVSTHLKRLGDDDKTRLLTLAEGRSMSPQALAVDPDWLDTVTGWVDALENDRLIADTEGKEPE